MSFGDIIKVIQTYWNYDSGDEVYYRSDDEIPSANAGHGELRSFSKSPSPCSIDQIPVDVTTIDWKSSGYTYEEIPGTGGLSRRVPYQAPRYTSVTCVDPDRITIMIKKSE